MAGPFGATSTTDEVLEGVNLSGKRILVTGVSAGLGVETARTLAAHGAQVVGAAQGMDQRVGQCARDARFALHLAAQLDQGRVVVGKAREA